MNTGLRCLLPPAAHTQPPLPTTLPAPVLTPNPAGRAQARLEGGLRAARPGRTGLRSQAVSLHGQKAALQGKGSSHRAQSLRGRKPSGAQSFPGSLVVQRWHKTQTKVKGNERERSSHTHTHTAAQGNTHLQAGPRKPRASSPLVLYSRSKRGEEHGHAPPSLPSKQSYCRRSVCPSRPV